MKLTKLKLPKIVADSDSYLMDPSGAEPPGVTLPPGKLDGRQCLGCGTAFEAVRVEIRDVPFFLAIYMCERCTDAFLESVSWWNLVFVKKQRLKFGEWVKWQ